MPGIITQNHMQTGLPAYEDQGGNLRFLSLRKPDPTRRMAMKQASDVFQLIPRSQWVNIDRRPIYGVPQFVLDQQQHGSCVGFSAAGAEMISRDLRGLTYARLSGSYVYSWINGGQDNGANIVDSLNALQTHGTCLDATCPVNSIYRQQSKAGDVEAARFKIAFGVAITSANQGNCFDWIGSIIQMGSLVQFAVEVGNNYENFDANGVAGFSRGSGNHSVYADGMIQINGVWYLTKKNSWNMWGPWKNGYVLLSEQHIQGVVDAGGEDAYSHVDVMDDPSDVNNPVVPAVA